MKRVICSAVMLTALAGCGTDIPVEASYPEGSAGTVHPSTVTGRGQTTAEDSNSLLGSDGIVLFGGPDYRGQRNDGGGGGGIGVNSYLWRATLDSVSFLPLESADPFGGVIITDWYAPPETPTERFKVTVYILDRSLRADGLRVSVFRQFRQRDGSWVDAPVNSGTAEQFENAILTRARQLRIQTASQ